MEDKIFIKNYLDTEIDYFEGKAFYEVRAMYDVKYSDDRGEWYETESELIEEVTIGIKDLAKNGAGFIVDPLKEKYDIAS